MTAWQAAEYPVATTTLVDATGARDAALAGAITLDVRETGEFAAGHITGAQHIPLGRLTATFAELPRDRPILADRGRSERSTTGLSLWHWPAQSRANHPPRARQHELRT